jgi:cytochrome c oxidase subunit 4
MSNEPNLAYNPDDPHGFHEDGHHGHVIVPWQILLGVLLVLFAFTGLTVFQSQFEKFAVNTWGWDIPGWVNIVLAMSIAVVKGTLVALFFMQLRYDKGINVILFLFTLMAVWFFIMFTALDLQNRGEITEWRSGEIVAGGTGVGFGENGLAVGREQIKKMTGPMFIKVRENYIAEFGIEQYEHELHLHHAAHGGKEEESNAWTSRTRSGLTPGLFNSGVWENLDDGHDEHGDSHGDDEHAEDHADEGHDTDATHDGEEHADDSHSEEDGGH